MKKTKKTQTSAVKERGQIISIKLARRQQGKKRSFRWIHILGIVLTVLLVGAAVFWSWQHSQQRVRTLELVRGYEFSGKYPIVWVCGDAMILGDDNGLRSYNTQEELLWYQSFEMVQPVLIEQKVIGKEETQAKYAAVCDIGGTKAIVFSEKGAEYRIALSSAMKILNASVNEQGMLVLIAQSDASEHILVYSSQGDLVMDRETKAERDGFPMEVLLSPDGSMLAAASTVYTSEQLRTVISLFQLTTQGLVYDDHLAASFSYDGTLIHSLYFGEDTMLAVLADRLAFYSVDGTPQELRTEKLTNQIAAVNAGSGGYAILYGPELSYTESGLEGKLIGYDFEGKKRFTETVPTGNGPVVLQNAGNELMVLGPGFAFGLDARGTHCWEYQGEETFRRCYRWGEDRAAVTAEGIYHCRIN